MLRPTAGQDLRHARFRANLTLDELAEKSDVSVGTIVTIEAGRQLAPFGRTVYRLATALGIDPKELLEPDEATA